jgi:hypothetical protein
MEWVWRYSHNAHLRKLDCIAQPCAAHAVCHAFQRCRSPCALLAIEGQTVLQAPKRSNNTLHSLPQTICQRCQRIGA